MPWAVAAACEAVASCDCTYRDHKFLFIGPRGSTETSHSMLCNVILATRSLLWLSPLLLQEFVVVSFFLRTLVWNRIMFPGKHRAVERSVTHLCWFEANVKQEAVFRTDERSTDFVHYWIHVADVQDHSPE